MWPISTDREQAETVAIGVAADQGFTVWVKAYPSPAIVSRAAFSRAGSGKLEGGRGIQHFLDLALRLHRQRPFGDAPLALMR